MKPVSRHAPFGGCKEFEIPFFLFSNDSGTDRADQRDLSPSVTSRSSEWGPIHRARRIVSLFYTIATARTQAAPASRIATGKQATWKPCDLGKRSRLANRSIWIYSLVRPYI